MKYPNSRKEQFVEQIFGRSVEDGYRWMEDESNEHLKTWIDEQNQLTQGHLKDIGSKEHIKERLEALFKYSSYQDLIVVGEYIIFSCNDGLQNQNIYYIQKGLDGGPKVLIDPNTLSEDGTVAVTLNGYSKDNRYLAYLQSKAGSDWHLVKIIDLETLELLEDELEWVKFTMVSWKDDGFYYSGYDAPKSDKVLSQKNTDMKVYYHKLGTAQSEDQLIYFDKENPLRYHSVQATESALILSSRGGTYGGEISLKSEGTENEFKVIFAGFDSEQMYIGSKDEYAYFLSDENAKNNNILRLNTSTCQVDCIVEETDVNLEMAYKVKDKLVLIYLEDVMSIIKIHDLNGDYIETLTLPDVGRPLGFVSSDELEEVLYGFTSYLDPVGFYAFKLDDMKSVPFKTSEVNFDKSDYVTKQIFAKSKDGTMVPAFVTHKKDLELNGENPTMLYAYGGFNNPIMPYFKPAVVYFIERGGIHVEANIRGGSEYGEAWHKAGMLFNKQNVFDDFISVAETLIEKKYTSKDRLAISGRSNGGLLMGAVMNQRPDLFSVVFPAVGVMDMLRYHKFTVGWGWAVEYGNPEEEVHFNNIIKYSPLHNIEGKDYPATLVFTADHDDRVVPAHSFKYIARLQEMNTSDQPMMIRIDSNSGHGAGKSVKKIIDEETDKFAFLFEHIK